METKKQRQRRPIVGMSPDNGCRRPFLTSCSRCPLVFCKEDLRAHSGLSPVALAIAATWKEGIYPHGMKELFMRETVRYWNEIPREAR